MPLSNEDRQELIAEVMEKCIDEKLIVGLLNNYFKEDYFFSDKSQVKNDETELYSVISKFSDSNLRKFL